MSGRDLHILQHRPHTQLQRNTQLSQQMASPDENLIYKRETMVHSLPTLNTMKPVKRILGPLDKRKTVTRCQSCARRKIKVSQPPPLIQSECGIFNANVLPSWKISVRDPSLVHTACAPKSPAVLCSQRLPPRSNSSPFQDRPKKMRCHLLSARSSLSHSSANPQMTSIWATSPPSWPGASSRGTLPPQKRLWTCYLSHSRRPRCGA